MRKSPYLPAILSILVSLALAQEPVLLTPPPDARYGFGLLDSESSIAVTDDYAFIATGAGSVYVYKLSGNDWILEATLRSDNPAREIYFGKEMAVSNDFVIISSSPSFAYVYKKTTHGWERDAKLIGKYVPYSFLGLKDMEKEMTENGIAGFEFGNSVAIGGNLAIVEAVGSKGIWPSAHIFRRNENGWAQDTVLTQRSGGRVFLSENFAVFADSVYKRSGNRWEPQPVRITLPDSIFDKSYSYLRAVSGDYALVRAFSTAQKIHATFLAKYDGRQWGQAVALTEVDPRIEPTEVEISDDYIAIAQEALESTVASFQFYIYKKNTDKWAFETVLQLPTNKVISATACSNRFLAVKGMSEERPGSYVTMYDLSTISEMSTIGYDVKGALNPQDDIEVNFTLPRKSPVKIDFKYLGSQLETKTVMDKEFPEGTHRVVIPKKDWITTSTHRVHNTPYIPVILLSTPASVMQTSIDIGYTAKAVLTSSGELEVTFTFPKRSVLPKRDSFEVCCGSECIGLRSKPSTYDPGGVSFSQGTHVSKVPKDVVDSWLIRYGKNFRLQPSYMNVTPYSRYGNISIDLEGAAQQ